MASLTTLDRPKWNFNSSKKRQSSRGLEGSKAGAPRSPRASEELLAETLWRRMDLVSVEQVMFQVVKAEMPVLKE